MYKNVISVSISPIDEIFYLLCLFTETHLDDSISDDVLAIPGHDVIIRKGRAEI